MSSRIRDQTPLFAGNHKFQPQLFTMSMKPLFSNNAQVYYKPGSLSVGAGTVRNIGHVAKRV